MAGGEGDWALEGTVLIACNCDYGCPCNVNGRPSRGKCEGGWTWHVGSGRFGKTALDGLSFAVFADWPGAIHEGGGRAVCFLDERADEPQRAALTALARGDAGGPWAIFATTYELDGPHLAPFEVEAAEERSSYRIGEHARLQVEPIRNPVTGNEVHPRLVLPEGLVVRELGLFASGAFRVEGGGVSYDHSGRYAAVGRFSYTGP
ncbi:MAG TPA: DUF1326 domain-containing protein [Gaiellaceae bacterium]|nr:DUF1326 domain-containing protein [Gaiellaceae bacterium]